MKRTLIILFIFLSSTLLVASCSQRETASPQRFKSLRKEFDKDLLLARTGKSGNVEDLRKRIAARYKEALASEPNAQWRTRYLLSETGLVSFLPKSAVHNYYHKRNLINNFGKQGIKLSGEVLRSHQQDPRWNMRDMAGAISLLESRKDEALGRPEAELALARTYLVLGRTDELLKLARERWGMKELTGEALYGGLPPFFEGLDDRPYEKLRKQRSEDVDIQLKKFQQWLRRAAAKPKAETISLSFSFDGKPLRGVNIVLFPEEDPRYLLAKRPYSARYPGVVLYDWALFGGAPIPDGTDSIPAVFPLRWAVSGDDGGIVFGDLPKGKYRVGDVLYDEAIFNDAWPNHAPDVSLHDVTFLALKEKASGALPRIRFIRAPVLEAPELQVVSPANAVLRWKTRLPQDWKKQPIVYRVLLQPALTAKMYAEELDVWAPGGVTGDRTEVRLDKIIRNPVEGIYRFKIAAVMNDSVVDETNTGMIVITREDAARTKESLAKLQETGGNAEALARFPREAAPRVVAWYAQTELQTTLADHDPSEAERLRKDLMDRLPKGHFLGAYVDERFRFLSP